MLVAQMVRNPPTVQEPRVRSLGLEDPLEKGMATHSSILAWRIPKDRGACRATVHGVAELDTYDSSSDSLEKAIIPLRQLRDQWLLGADKAHTEEVQGSDLVGAVMMDAWSEP